MIEKYITKSQLDSAIEELCKKYNISYGGESMGFGRELSELSDRLTAANVVHVDRCKDCLFYGEAYEGDHYCDMLDCEVPGENFYCRDAVEKEHDLMDEEECDNK